METMTKTEVQKRMERVREHERYLASLYRKFEREFLLPIFDRLNELVKN